MKKFKQIFVVLLAGAIVLTSATVVPKSTKVPVVSAERIASVNDAITAAKADGKITKTELRNIFSIAKGSKLTFKEKLAVKLFNKKIGNKLMADSAKGGEGKSQLIALIICGLIGGLGIHRFYLGYIWQGVVQLLTLGGCGIWTLIDFVRIIMGSLKPKDGEYGTSL